MQTTLTTIALVASALGLAYCILTGGRQRYARAWRTMAASGWRWVVVLAVILLGAGVAATVPALPPFTPGLQLGWGVLIGGLLAVWVGIDAASDGSRTMRSVLPVVAAGFGVSLVLCIFPGDPTDVLAGAALAAVGITTMISGVLRARGEMGIARSVELYGIATTAVVIATRLGIEHFPRHSAASVAGGYWAVPALLMSVGGLVLILLQSEKMERMRWLSLLSGVLAAAVMVVAALAMQLRALPQLSWLTLLVTVVVFGGMFTLLHAEERVLGARGAYRPLLLVFGLALSVLVIVVFAFRQLQGYGEALALIPMVVITGAAYLRRETVEGVSAPLGIGAAVLLLLFALTRLILESVGRGYALDFQRHYDMFALVLGAAALFGMMAVLAQGSVRKAGSLTQATGLLLLAGATAVIPLVVFTVWGVQTLLALMVGLTLGELLWLMLCAWSTDRDRGVALSASPHLYVIFAGVVAAQFSPWVQQWDLLRSQKLAFVLAVTGVAVLWVVLDAIVRHRRLAQEDNHAVA